MNRGLSRLQFWGCLVVLLALFLFWNGPVWEHAWDVDASAVVSYIPIPFLVLGLLLWSKRFSWKWLFLDTLALTLLKFAVTYALATALWATGDAPKKHEFQQPNYAPPSPPERPPPATPLDPATTGVVEGAVLDADGAPVDGAVVWIDGDFDGRVFAPPAAPLMLEASAGGIRPSPATVQTWQPIRLRSTDGALHTIAARDGGGERVFNRAAPADGSVAEVVLRDDEGLVTVYCRLHEAAGTEPTAILGVFAHPFHSVTGADGAFRFAGVPAGHIRIATTGATADAEVTAGGSARVELRVR